MFHRHLPFVRTRRASAGAACVSLACLIPGSAAAVADPGSLLDMSPASSLVVFGCDDLNECIDAFAGTPLGALWKTEEMQDIYTPVWEDMLESVQAELAVDLEFDELGWPTGLLGGSAYLVDPEEEGAKESPIGFIFFAEWDQRPDEAQRLFDLMMDEARNDEELTIEETRYEDRAILSLIPPAVDREERLAELREEWDEELTDEDIAWYEEQGYFDPDTPEMHYALDDGLLIISTQIESVKETIDRIDGVDLPSADDNDLFRNELDFVRGESGGVGFYVVGGLNEDTLSSIDSLVSQFGASTPLSFMTSDEYEQLATMTGLDRIKAVAMSVHPSNGSGVMIDQVLSVFMPDGPGGLFDLFGAPDSFDPPDWIDPAAGSVYQVQFRFDEIVPTIRDAIALAGDDEMTKQIAMMFETQIAETLSLVASELGPRVVISMPSIDPDTFENRAASLVAIEVRDDLIVQNVMIQFRQAWGITSREFAGHQVFDMAGPTPISIGFGKGEMLVGSTGQVEAALRADEETPGLPAEPGFKQSAERLPREAVALGLTPARRAIEDLILTFKQQFDAEAQREQLRATYRQFDIEIDEAELEWIQSPDWYDRLEIPEVEFFLDFIGDSIFSVQLREDRVVARSRVLQPAVVER